jgi:thiamine biosynthesis lipoprotein
MQKVAITKQKIFTESIPSMTSILSISILLDENQDVVAKELLQKGFDKANELIKIISAWEEGTQMYAVNQAAGLHPVAVCDELFYLIQRGLKISELTKGLFDITFASLDKVWYFDRPMLAVPSETVLAESVRNINYKYVQLDAKNKTVFVTNKGTKIELGAIGKGYIANKIKELLIIYGIQSGLVNAGGDLVCWGKNSEGLPWRVGIADPNKEESHIAWLPLENQAVATSGSYERFALINGEKYSHIIHPQTGYPVKGLKSVTIISPDAELCDAIATSVFLLGLEKGLEFVNQFEDIQCFMVDNQNQYYYSDNLNTNKYVQQN